VNSETDEHLISRITEGHEQKKRAETSRNTRTDFQPHQLVWNQFTNQF